MKYQTNENELRKGYIYVCGIKEFIDGFIAHSAAHNGKILK